MRQLAVRAGVIDRQRQLLGEHFGKLIDRDIEPCGQFPDLFAAKHLLQLVRGNRQVLPVSDPGFDLVAKTGLFELATIADSPP